MRILLTNDDGIHSEGLWLLVQELSNIASIIVVTSDSEQSAIGTAVTLRHPLKTQKVKHTVSEVEAYAIDGTPSDSVILALGKLAKDRVDMVISGINDGSNLGEDVYISGTVGAALQGYFRGLPAIAISAPRGNKDSLNAAARFAAIMVKKMITINLPEKLFLNINVPDTPLDKITGVKITRLARESHINTVEESTHGRRKHYWLIREQTAYTIDSDTDIRAIQRGNISITPLYFNLDDKPPYHILKNMCSELLQELRD